MKTAEEWIKQWDVPGVDYDPIKEGALINFIERRDKEWRERLQKVFNETTNFHCKEVLQKLIEE